MSLTLQVHTLNTLRDRYSIKLGSNYLDVFMLCFFRGFGPADFSCTLDSFSRNINIVQLQFGVNWRVIGNIFPRMNYSSLYNIVENYVVTYKVVNDGS